MGADVDAVALAGLADLVVPGEPLPFALLDAHGRLLLAAGQVIRSERQWEALLERCACAAAAEVQSARDRLPQTPATPRAVRERNLFDRWEEQIWRLDGLLRSLGRGEAPVAALEAMADDIMALVAREPDAALFLCVRQDDRRVALYSLAHALHTATVALLAGQLLAWSPPVLRSLVRAALTMNASIVELQARMAQQPDPPGRRQLDEIRAHPVTSAQWLRSAGVGDALWLQAVEQHRERPGGGGYPHGLQAVDEPVRLLRAADLFTAGISPRVLRAAVAPQQAMRTLFQDEGGGPLAAALIKAVGIYPPGDFVRLKNGDAAIVIRRATAGEGAQAVSLLDERGRALATAPRRDTAQPEFGIAAAIPADERAALPRVLPEQVYGLLPV